MEQRDSLKVCRLIPTHREKMVAVPETGMGFQFVKVTLRFKVHSKDNYSGISEGLHLVFNCEIIVPFAKAEGVISYTSLSEVGRNGKFPSGG